MTVEDKKFYYEEQKIYNVGIDLGTSRTVIACSNGVRMFIPSYVGYPKDIVSKKLLGKDILFGEDVIKNRMMLNLFSPIEKGVIRYSDKPEANPEGYKKTITAAREILKYLLEPIKKEAKGDFLIRGVIGAPALASITSKKALFDISKGLLDDVLITSEPFAVAYGLNLLSNALIIDIGAGTVDMCRMHGTLPDKDDQTTTFKAGNHIDSVFYDSIMKKYENVKLTTNMVKKFKEENSFVSEHGEKILIDLPIDGKPVSLDVTQELKDSCASIVPDIVEGIKSLISTFDPEFQNGLKENVILAGGGSQIIGLKKEIENYMKETLGYGKVSKVEEPLYAGANGALMLCKDMTDENWNELKKQADKIDDDTRQPQKQVETAPPSEKINTINKTPDVKNIDKKAPDVKVIDKKKGIFRK